jgi:signal transduction histidine kinase
MSTWETWNSRQRTFAIAVLAVLVVSIAYAVVVRNVLLGGRGTTAFDDIGEAVAAAAAAAACAWAATQASGRDRLAWSLMGISAGLWGAGEIVWSIYEVGLNVQTPYPSLADVGFLSAVPFAIAGIRAFWSAPHGTPARWRVWFDGVIVSLALTSTAWAFGLRAVWQSDSSTKLLDLAYPVSDILIGTILILAIRRANQQQAGRMAFLLAGIVCYSIADSAFAYLNAQGAFGAVGNVIDTGWFAGFFIIALAATYPAVAPKPATQQAPLDLWQLALPWMTLLLASAGDVYSSVSGHEIDLFMSSLTAAIAILLTLNMIVERREFLEMLTDIETARTTLNREFKTALAGIQQLSDQVNEADRAYDADVRRLAADIHDQAERLDHLVEGML